ncbi:hypothetical protein GDO86_018911 [Hymenochirus boettgeri]|uniref:Uncharacterized protein n=1 Tax=Hymenochirus boettgeri TaxID=247094 RepID=A0A8T2IE03_9PIPI|nr:hypothetical protein GDO86_018911 [Hymenochirus boettgeri]
MASADLRDELICSICTDIYSDPVTLPCGHNYCHGCIEKTWDWHFGTDEDPKCSKHHKFLEYFCCEDGACVCVSCCLFGNHREHKVEPMDEASGKKKEKLRQDLGKLTPERDETENRVQRLQENKREVKEKSTGETERVTVLFRDIREQLEVIEKRVKSEISRQEEELSLILTELIQQQNKEKEDLSKKIHHREELCSMADPFTVLQDKESDAICSAEGGGIEETGRENLKVSAIGNLDMDLISETLLTGLAGIVTGVKGRFCGQEEVPDLLLDINTAGNCVIVSGDGRSATFTLLFQCRPQTTIRFQPPQVLSTRSFSSGRHYWDVEGSESGIWGVGVSYPSIGRLWCRSYIGNNNKSWGLYRLSDKSYSVRHDGKVACLHHVPSSRKIRISLDYEAGRLSYYELSDPIRHLHTFTAPFTEPLHAAFWVEGLGNNWVRITS